MKKQMILKIVIILLIYLLISSIFYSIIAVTGSETVYITKTGSKYHLYGCDYLNDRPYKTTINNAINYGYAPCKVCNPYGLAGTDTQNDDPLDFIILLLNLALTIALYMGVPFYLRYKKLKFNSKKELLQFVIGYSVAIYTLYFLIYVGRGEPKMPNLIPPFFYGAINYKMLEKFIKIPTTSLNKDIE